VSNNVVVDLKALHCSLRDEPKAEKVLGILEDAIEMIGKQRDALTEKSREIISLRAGDCQFNCRADRKADYIQGWTARDRDCPLPNMAARCADRYIEKNPARLSSYRRESEG